MATLYKHLLAISLNETRCEQRGFTVQEPLVKSNIERIGECFVYGYHAALDESRNDFLQGALTDIENDFRGFAYEGAGMALALLELLTPWKKNRFNSFIEQMGATHVYMVYIG